MAEEIDFENRPNWHFEAKPLSSGSRDGHVTRDGRDLLVVWDSPLVALSSGPNSSTLRPFVTE